MPPQSPAIHSDTPADDMQWQKAFETSLKEGGSSERSFIQDLKLISTSAIITEAPPFPRQYEELNLADRWWKNTPVAAEKLAREDMTPESFARYERMAKDAGMKSLSGVYVNRQDASDMPHAFLKTTTDHRHIMLINDSEHQYTGHYVRKTMPSDAQLRAKVQSGELHEINRDTAPEAYARYERLAIGQDRMSLPYAPALYLYNGPTHAGMTQEGAMYITLNNSLMKGLDDKEVEATLAHELAHHRNGNLNPDHIAAAVNGDITAVSLRQEKKADLDASGPLGTCDPIGLADALAIMTRLDQQKFLKNNPEKSPADYDREIMQSNTHPPLLEREYYLHVAAKRLPVECFAHELQTAPATPLVSKASLAREH